MSNQSLPVKSDMYHILEKADEDQIRAADEKVKEALVYEVHGDYHLSYAGVKHLSLLMSQKGQPLKIVNAEVEIRKEVEEDRATWIWDAKVVVRNDSTGHETVGVSEAPYFYSGNYDSFGKTKALNKAERNAIRKQLPELQIEKMVQEVRSKGDRITKVEQPKESTKNTTQETTQSKVVQPIACVCDEPRISANTGVCLACGKKAVKKKSGEDDDILESSG